MFCCLGKFSLEEKPSVSESAYSWELKCMEHCVTFSAHAYSHTAANSHSQ